MANLYKNSRDSGFGTFLSKTILFVLALFSLCLVVLNLSFSFKNDALIYSILVVPVLAILFLASYKFNISPLVFGITIFVLAFLFKGTLAVMTDTKPFSDFSTFYYCAIKLLHGDKGFGHTFYFSIWGYQTGPILYYAAAMKLLGTGLLQMKLVNCFFMAGSNLLIYLIARKISNDCTARFAAFLYLLFPAPYFLAPVMTNQHFAACMFLLSIYILLIERLNFILRGILAGVVMALGNAVRPLGIVIAGAAVIWGIVECIRRKKLIPICLIAILLIGYFSLSIGISEAVKYYDVDPVGLSNNFPLWKFVVGLNQNSNGQFSYEDQNKIFYIEDSEKRNAAAKEAIKERLSVGPVKLLYLFTAKQQIMWAEFDTLRWGFYKQVGSQLTAPPKVQKYEPYILRIEKVYYTIGFILMLLGLLSVLFRKKSINSGLILVSTILLCYLGAHIFIEIQVRYRYFALMLVFILAAKGSELLYSGLQGYRKKYSV